MKHFYKNHKGPAYAAFANGQTHAPRPSRSSASGLYPQCLRPQRVCAQQRGSTLLVVLLLILVMTVLAVLSLRGTVLQERMSSNLYDRGMAFQAAEEALRQGEQVALAGPLPPKTGCTGGLCAMPTVDEDRPRGDSGWVNAAALSDNTLAVPKPENLQYLVEYMGTYKRHQGCGMQLNAVGQINEPLCIIHSYRVSARYQATGRASVLLQSTVGVPLMQEEPITALPSGP